MQSHQENKQTLTALDLAQFTGSEQFFRHSLNRSVLYTGLYQRNVTLRYVSHHPLESSAIPCGRGGVTQIAVDHDDFVAWPPQSDGAIAQRVLALGTFVFSNTCRIVDCRT